MIRVGATGTYVPAAPVAELDPANTTTDTTELTNNAAANSARRRTVTTTPISNDTTLTEVVLIYGPRRWGGYGC
jgi:hypothetical protein